MKFFPDLGTFVEIGSFQIRWYAILIITGAFIAYYIILNQSKKAGYNPQIVEDMFVGTLLSGIVGARIWYVLFFDLKSYLADPIKIISTWEGGLAIQGGLFFGALYVLIYTRKKKVNFIRMGDIILPNVLIAQAIGRWGNFLNQEAFGDAVAESYFKYFPSFIKDIMFINGQYRVPTFLYESLLNIAGWALIVLVYRKFGKPKRGNLIYSYLVWYGITRFIVEGMRTDSLYFLGTIRIAQLISVLFVLVGLLGFAGVFRKLLRVKPTVLFDFDGTLGDTEPLILETFRKLLEKYRPDIEITREIELSILGPTLTEVINMHFPDEDHDTIYQEYLDLNIKIHPEYIKEIAGAKDLLAYLKEQGYKIGIVSNKRQHSLKVGMELLDHFQYVDVIIGIDDVDYVGKPDPRGIKEAVKLLDGNTDDVVYIGDSVGDMQASIRANAYTIAYIHMPEREAEIIATNPNKVIKSLDEIKTILKENDVWTHDLT